MYNLFIFEWYYVIVEREKNPETDKMIIKNVLGRFSIMFEIVPYGRKHRGDIFDPFSGFDRDFFGESDMKPIKTDVIDNGDSYLLEAELPGFKKEDIHIDVENGFLTISANTSSEKEEKCKNGYIRRERYSGSVARSFDVSEINTENITADYVSGVLKLTLPKKDEIKSVSRRIELK